MFGKFTYTDEHEKDWQKLDREFGPLKSSADARTNSLTDNIPDIEEWPLFKKLIEANGRKPDGKVGRISGVQIYFWGAGGTVRKQSDGSLLINCSTSTQFYTRNLRSKQEYERSGLNILVSTNGSM